MAKVSVNTYNAIVPQKESNVNAWFGSSNRFVAALADVFGVDDAAPKCAGAFRVHFDLDLEGAFTS